MSLQTASATLNEKAQSLDQQQQQQQEATGTAQSMADQ